MTSQISALGMVFVKMAATFMKVITVDSYKVHPRALKANASRSLADPRSIAFIIHASFMCP